MSPSTALREARRKAKLSQRALALKTGIAQPAIARIESGVVVPRIDTLDRLLRACGRSLEVERRTGEGLDRSVIRELLKLSPRERAIRAAEDADNLQRLLQSASR